MNVYVFYKGKSYFWKETVVTYEYDEDGREHVLAVLFNRAETPLLVRLDEIIVAGYV